MAVSRGNIYIYIFGLSLLQRIARAAMSATRPPVTTNGEAAQAFLSQEALRSAYRAVNVESQFDPDAAQISGLTPFSFAAGSLPTIYDQQVSLNIMTGSFGSEIGLIADAASRQTVLAWVAVRILPLKR